MGISPFADKNSIFIPRKLPFRKKDGKLHPDCKMQGRKLFLFKSYGNGEEKYDKNFYERNKSNEKNCSC